LIVQIINPSIKSSWQHYKDYFNLYETDSIESSLVRVRDFPAEKITQFHDFLSDNNIKFKIKAERNDTFNCYVLTNLAFFQTAIKKMASAISLEITNAINRYTKHDEINYNISGRSFYFNRCYVMGILNVTPDSFSDGGLYATRDFAISKALEMLDEGADIIDIGGESSRPGAEVVSLDEEKERVIPVIEEILKSRPNAIVSVDTYKSEVAKVSLEKGAKIINDISGGTFQPEILDVIKDYNGSMVIMHIKGTPKNMQANPKYENLIEEIYDFLYIQVQNAKGKGIKNIFIDPGIGFGKTVENNFEIIKRLGDFKSIGYPILIGLSRKSFLGKSLNLDINNRDTATSIMETASALNGAKMIRTHNVKNGIQICKLLNKLNQNV